MLKNMIYGIKYIAGNKILKKHTPLIAAIKNDWVRPLDICRIYESNDVYECCRFAGDAELCKNYGYLSYAEIDQALKLKSSAILNAFRYF